MFISESEYDIRPHTYNRIEYNRWLYLYTVDSSVNKQKLSTNIRIKNNTIIIKVNTKYKGLI